MTLKEYIQSKNRMIILIIITLVILSWTLINANGFILPAIIYMVLGAVSIFLILIFDKFGNKSNIYGISKNFGKDLLIGCLFGGGFILIQSFNIIGSVLIPYIPASLVQDFGRISIIVLGAGVIESIFFLSLLTPFLDEKLKDFGIDLPFIIALLLVCILFPIFHATAYGQVSATIGSYISAGVFLFASGLIMRYSKSITPLVISHMLINFWILNQQFHYINFG